MLKKLIKPLLIGLSLVALYALLGFYLVPYLLKTKLPTLLTEQTKTPASLTNATFNPFKLCLSLQGFELKDKQQQPFVKFNNLLLDVDGFNSLKTLGLVVEQLQAEKLEARVVRHNDGQFNFDALFPPSPKQPADSKESDFPLLFKQVQLVDGSLTWVDQRIAKPETETFAPLNLTLSDLSLRQNRPAKVAFSAQLDVIGKLEGQLSLSLKPFASKGHIQLTSIKAERLWALFLQDQVNFKLPQGESNLGFDYDLAYPADQLQLIITEGKLTSRKLQLTSLDNAKPVISVPDLNISGIHFDMLKQSLDIANAETNAVSLSMASNAKGEFNMHTIFSAKTVTNSPKPSSPPSKPDPAGLPWLINIAKLSIHKLKAEYQHQSDEMPLQAKWEGLDFEVADTQMNIDKGRTRLTSKAGKMAVQNAEVHDFRFHPASPFLAAKGEQFEMGLGQFQLEYDAQKPLQIIAGDGEAKIKNHTLHMQGLALPLIDIHAGDLNGATFDLVKQQVTVAELQGNGAKLSAWLEKNGQLNYLALFSKTETHPKTVAPVISPKTNAGIPWAVSLAELDLQNLQFDFEDKMHAKPVAMQLSALNIKAQQLSTQQGQKLPFSLSTKINREGRFDVKGQVVLSPFKADLQATLSDLALKTFQPYLNDYARVDIIDGDANTSAKITLSQSNAKADIDVRVKGSVNIKELVTRDQILNKDLFKWQSFKLDDIDFGLTPLKINIGNVLFQKPYARVTIKKDRSLNFTDIIVKPSAPGSATPEVKPALVTKTAPPQFKIAAVTVADGTSDFSDFSLILPFVVELNELNGAVKGFSSQQKQLADFNMTGKVFDLSPMEMNSQFSPDFSVLDVGLHFKGMPLPFVSPYMVEFAGYKIEKGKMSLDLLYKINDRKLVAENNLVLDQLTLGEKVENPKATSLPLNLAITLLKDSNGKININLPLTGSLDDPQFSVTSLVFDAFVNMLTKVISSPFKALGALTASDTDMSQVIFKEGSNSLSDTEKAKLLEMAKALAQKPDLSVEIKGSAYTKQDWPALQDDALLDQLKANKAEELKAKGKKQLAEYIDLNKDEQLRLLGDLYIKKFPKLAKRSLFGTPELIGSDKDFETVAKHQLEVMIPPDPQRLSALAVTRARNIAQVLIKEGKIPQERIFILDSNVQAEADKAGIVTEMSLRVQ